MVSIANVSHAADDDEKSCCGRCCSITWNILKEMGNISLLKKNMAFLLIVASNFFIFSGYFIPFIYVPLRAKELEIAKFSLILGLIGIINIPARLVFGVLADKVSPTNLNTMCALIATAALWIYAPLTTFTSQCVFSVLFAIGIGFFLKI